MRLRPLSEAECYARCYGGNGDGTVSVVRLDRRPESPALAGERLRQRFEARLDAHGPEAEAA
ncbi:MAG: hypothetical protein ACRDM1_11390 [Gaiellaceae bacterium]